MKINNKTTDKWEKSGLLQHLTDDDKDKLALLLEEMANILFAKQEELKNLADDTRYDELMFSSIFPVVVRLFHDNSEKMPTMDWLFHDFLQFITQNWNKYTKDCINKIDGEAELLTTYTDIVYKTRLQL